MKLWKLNIYTIALLLAFHQANTQNAEHFETVGESIIIHSKVLNEEREIQIYLPENYSQSARNYPVLYVLDGQRYFLNGITFQKNLSWRELVPDFIVVGIVTDARKRRNLFYQESDKFIEFLEKELIAKIDSDYRTLTKERIYFGWEMAAGLGVQIMTSSPTLFKGYLLSSPTHVSTSRLEKMNESLSHGFDREMMTYATLGTVENWAISSMASLDSLFQKYKYKNLSWTYNLSDDENHYTTPLTTINKGLKTFFDDYGPIRFYSLQEFKKYGGLNALQTHYQNRADRYQISNTIHDDTKHYLLLQAHKEDDFEVFDELVEAFDGKVFIFKYYRQPRWFNRFSQFYLANNRINDAIEILRLGTEKFPNTPVLENEMGNCFKMNGDVSSAKEWYDKAISNARKSNDPELATYIKNLESL